MKFKQGMRTGDPKIIGVYNGTYQLELDETTLEKHKDFEMINHLFIKPRRRDIEDFNENVQNLNSDIIFELKPIRKAKMTDIMGFSPFFFSCRHIVSQRFVDCLYKIKVDKSECKLFPVSITNIKERFYLLFIPMIPHEQINFSSSILYVEKPELEIGREYLSLNSFREYKQLMEQYIHPDFEKVCLPNRFSTMDIIDIQGLVETFFSSRLMKEITSSGISNFIFLNHRTRLIFSE